MCYLFIINYTIYDLIHKHFLILLPDALPGSGCANINMMLIMLSVVCEKLRIQKAQKNLRLKKSVSHFSSSVNWFGFVLVFFQVTKGSKA